jgi:hypothetical protein
VDNTGAFLEDRTMSAAMPPGRSRTTSSLHDLRARLTELHKMLLDDERDRYEATHGPVGSGPALLQLLLHHQQFAWLRSLSAMIATIDAAFDETEGPLDDAQIDGFFRAAHALLRSGGDSPFETNYRETLQRSPDIVMAHAAVVKLF